jgi:hypothetical protein
MKKNVLIFSVVGLVGLAAGIYSCSHEMEIVPSDETAVIRSIEKAKEFLVSGAGELSLPDTYYKANGDEPGTRSPEMQSLLSGAIQPDWSLAQVWEWEGDVFTEMPVTLTSPIRYTTLIEERGDVVSLTTQAPHTRVRIIENHGTGAMTGFVVTMLPDDLYTGNLYELTSNPEGSDFSGIIVYSLLDGIPQWGWRYDAGEIANILLFNTEYEEHADPYVRIFMGFMADTATRGDYFYDYIENGDGDRYGGHIQDIICHGFTRLPEGGSSGGYSGGYYYFPPDEPYRPEKSPMKDSGYGDGGGGGGKLTPKPDAPLSKKLFNIKDADTKKVEKMLEEILIDCMGGKLNGDLQKEMNGGKLQLNFVNNSVLGGKFSLSNGITITGYDSEDLFHEMFHAFQSYQETVSSFNNSSANRELEAYLAEYMYSGKLTGGNSFDADVQSLFDLYLTENGTLKDPSMEAMFNSMFKDVANHIKTKYERWGNSTPYDDKRTGMQSIANIRHLAQNC